MRGLRNPNHVRKIELQRQISQEAMGYGHCECCVRTKGSIKSDDVSKEREVVQQCSYNTYSVRWREVRNKKTKDLQTVFWVIKNASFKKYAPEGGPIEAKLWIPIQAISDKLLPCTLKTKDWSRRFRANSIAIPEKRQYNALKGILKMRKLAMVCL